MLNKIVNLTQEINIRDDKIDKRLGCITACHLSDDGINFLNLCFNLYLKGEVEK